MINHFSSPKARKNSAFPFSGLGGLSRQVIAGICWVAFTGWAQAQAELGEGRPGRAAWSTSSTITGEGVVDLETGIHRTENRDRSSVDFGLTVLYLGLSPRFDLRLAWNGPQRITDPEGRSQHGLSDPLLGFQFLLAQQDRVGMDLALAYFHKVPTASTAKGMGTGAHDDSVFLILTRKEGPWVFDLNLMQNWIGRAGGVGRIPQPAVGVCATRRLSERWHCTADTYALGASELGPRVISTNWSLTFEAGAALALDFGVDVGLTQSSQKWTAYAGFAYSFGKWF